ncbi:phenylalanine--tRNA ligase alpha subunit-like [Hydractinia symbiolongicarpus]|uniref:phenylalanine--tRNA ligase alpha subunit-like n=1 Tax=Hydractinia symbiolongicarpus TaxID=13093 RepID=UPI002549E12F|nr:phenylalanine--tRNA ligase alpha subunit-like [Hydractinia symbiolongicarpus]
MAEEIDLLILQRVDKYESVNTFELASEHDKDHQIFVGAVKRLQSLGEIICATLQQSEKWILTSEGLDMANNGSYEAVVFNNIPEDGLLQADLQKLPLGKNVKIGFSKAMSAGWLSIDKTAEGGPRIHKKVEKIEDCVQTSLKSIKDGESIDESNLADLKKRKLIAKEILKSYLVTKGKEFTLTIEKPETDLTTEMLISGSWKTKKFKDYNFDALGIPPVCGHLHPLMKVRTEFRQIFLEMGFTEMPTNNFVESSFWNFDALFQPQQHPARDAHDTFFLSEPQFAKLDEVPKDYLERVRTTHQEGGYGSQGYQYKWDIMESKKNILRTHTTAVSSRMLYKLAQQQPFRPAKYFSIDRVFRNESLDATHLAEFHQIEGLVADKDLSLGHLIGLLYEFFKKLGIEKLRFKPAYNPYTEPSMEIFSYHEGLKKWVEIGNSGVFRPEMLLPMGLPRNVSVIAWGLSLERPTMIKYGIQNIRDLIGHKINLEMVYKNPICQLDKD